MNRSEIMEQFEQVLANTISPNHLDSTAASDFLENVIATDIASVFLALSRIMADDRLGAPIRKQAGLKLKKVVYSHEIDPEINESRWLQLPADIRAEIKAHCYQALCMQDQVSDMAAQCVARVARVELPGGHWPELMDLLYTQITDYNSPDLVKRACILAIGYICYDIITEKAVHQRSVYTKVSPSDQIWLQCIILWVIICKEEIKLGDDKQLLPREVVNILAPRLFQILERQEEVDDEDEWNPHKAAVVCLGHLSQTCEEAIVELVLQSIQQENWRKRNAAVMAFCSILEGPRPGFLGPLVTQVMPVITKLLADPEAVVRKTAAWTVRNVCDVLPHVLLDDACLSALLPAMVTALSSEPKVATDVCWAFSSLALDLARFVAEPDTYNLSQYFTITVEQLLQTAYQPDFRQSDLRNAASTALTKMIRYAPRDCCKSIMVLVFQKLEGILGMDQAALSAQDRSQLAEYQSLLYDALQPVLMKIDCADAQNMANQIMDVLMKMFKSAQSNAPVLNNNNPAYSDQNTARYLLQQIISAFGDFAFLLGDSFAEYRGQVIETLIQACQPKVVVNDPDMIDYLNTLRQCCIEAFVRLILSAWSSGNGNQYPSTAQDNIEKFQLIIPHMQVIIPFMEHIAVKQVSSEELIGACCGLVGDIATGFGIASLEILDTESIKMLLAKGSKCDSMSTNEYAASAIEEMNKLRSM